MGKPLPQLGTNRNRNSAAKDANPASVHETADWHKGCNTKLDAVMAAV